MYSEYEGKNEVLLWFYIPQPRPNSITAGKRSRSRSPGSGKNPKQKKSSNYESKLDEVETIVTKLKDKNSGKYPEEKLRMWGHLIQMGKHASYDEPPDLPFFRGRAKKTSVADPPSLAHPNVPDSGTSNVALST